VVSVGCFVLWQKGIFNFGITVGLGIFAYGLAYFIVHDIFIHQRFKLFRNANNRFSRAVRRAHKIHHKNVGKSHGECFGMLVVPYKYYKK
jgi:beta-carotene 3-hydroxylase